jgi:putative oxidoreductase
MRSLYTRFLHLENHLHHRLVQHSITALRIAVGAVFLGFGILKYFPGVSPAQNLTEATTHILFFGLVPGDVAIVLIATLECTIGILLLANRGMRVAIWLLAAEFIGILSPLVLLAGRLFAGPHHAPTLEGQYCLKDIILVAAALVIAAGTFRGGRMVRGDLPPAARVRDGIALDPDQKLRIVLEGISDANLVGGLCATNHISEAQFYDWRDTSLAGATTALSADGDLAASGAVSGRARAVASD